MRALEERMSRRREAANRGDEQFSQSNSQRPDQTQRRQRPDQSESRHQPRESRRERERDRRHQGDDGLESTIRDIQQFAASKATRGRGQGGGQDFDGSVAVPPQMERMFMQWMDSRQSQWEQRYEAQQEQFMADIARHEQTIAQLGEQVRPRFHDVI